MKVAILGSSGMLGSKMLEVCQKSGLEAKGLSRPDFDAEYPDFSKIKDFGYMPIILTSEAVRLVVRNFLKKINPGIIVLGVPEISSEVNCRQVGVVDFE